MVKESGEGEEGREYRGRGCSDEKGGGEAGEGDEGKE